MDSHDNNIRWWGNISSHALHMVGTWSLRTALRGFMVLSVPGRSSRSIFHSRGSLPLVIQCRDSAPYGTALPGHFTWDEILWNTWNTIVDYAESKHTSHVVR